MSNVVISNLVGVCLVVALVFLVAERVFPARRLPTVPGWWTRVVIVNLIQAGLVIAGGYLWDPFFAGLRIDVGMKAVRSWSPIVGGAFGYFVLSFVYYWWHRWRHRVPLFWRWLHQMHHTPSRIETITSFYKHPFEILTNTVLTSFTLYIVIGVYPKQATWAVFFLAVAEYCYHVNIRTPHWLGYFIQRPETHRLHHQRGVHAFNYSDLPIWDILFGTYRNPVDQPEECGLGLENEIRLAALLKGEALEDS